VPEPESGRRHATRSPLADPLPRLTFVGFARVRSDLDSEVPKFATTPFTVSAGQSAEES
jgi:hypothetical protein